MGYKTNAATMELNDILPEDVEQKVKEAAEVSMGTEISEEDLSNITNLCDQVSDQETLAEIFSKLNFKFFYQKSTRFLKYPITAINYTSI